MAAGCEGGKENGLAAGAGAAVVPGAALLADPAPIVNRDLGAAGAAEVADAGCCWACSAGANEKADFGVSVAAGLEKRFGPLFDCSADPNPSGEGAAGCELPGAGVAAGVEEGKEKGVFCSEVVDDVVAGVGPEVLSAGLNGDCAGGGPKLNPEGFGSGGFNEGCPGVVPKLNPVERGSPALRVSAALAPKLNPDPFAASSAGLEPKRLLLDPPVLAPNAEVVGGGPAGVVEGPKLKGLLGAGVVEPNSGAGAVVAGVLAEDLSGVPNPPKILPVAGWPPVEPAGVVVLCPSLLVAAGLPKLKPVLPPPVG